MCSSLKYGLREISPRKTRESHREHNNHDKRAEAYLRQWWSSKCGQHSSFIDLYSLESCTDEIMLEHQFHHGILQQGEDADIGRILFCINQTRSRFLNESHTEISRNLWTIFPSVRYQKIGYFYFDNSELIVLLRELKIIFLIFYVIFPLLNADQSMRRKLSMASISWRNDLERFEHRLIVSLSWKLSKRFKKEIQVKKKLTKKRKHNKQY